MNNKHVDVDNGVTLILLNRNYVVAINTADLPTVSEYPEWRMVTRGKRWKVISRVDPEDSESDYVELNDVIQASLLNRGNVPENSLPLFGIEASDRIH